MISVQKVGSRSSAVSSKHPISHHPIAPNENEIKLTIPYLQENSPTTALWYEISPTLQPGFGLFSPV